ncbi:MAG: hypothetical protein GTO62_16890 [Planctomycetales bacterium]|nr:hypothetical protein [Planctomycetales bacterium]
MADETLPGADHVLREFFEYRFGTLEERLDRLADAFHNLSSAIITRAAFDELSHDVVETEHRLERAEARIRDLEELVRFGKFLVTGLVVIVGPLAIDKLRELFS